MNNMRTLLLLIVISALNLLITSFFQKLLSNVKHLPFLGFILPVGYSISGIVCSIAAIIGFVTYKDVWSFLQVLTLVIVHIIHIIIFIKIYKKVRNEIVTQ